MTNEKKAEVMKIAEGAEEEKSEKEATSWWRLKKAQYGIIVGACVLVLIGVGIAIAGNQPVPAGEEQAAETSQVEQVTTHELKVTLDLPEWSEDSTPALLEVNDGIETSYNVIESSSPYTVLSLENGNYTLSLISPINVDGSIYMVSDPQTIEVNNTTLANIETIFAGTKLPAEDVIESQINAIKAEFEKGRDAGKIEQKTVEKLSNNSNAGIDARNTKSDEEKQQAQEAVKQETQQKQASSNATKSGNSSGDSNQSQQSTSAHQHSWSPIYRIIHHKQIDEQQPIYETQYKSICNVCGADVTGNAAAHAKSHMKNGENAGHHEESKSVIVGYKTVVTQAAYDEQVLDHYACSCGATS